MSPGLFGHNSPSLLYLSRASHWYLSSSPTTPLELSSSCKQTNDAVLMLSARVTVIVSCNVNPQASRKLGCIKSTPLPIVGVAGAFHATPVAREFSGFPDTHSWHRSPGFNWRLAKASLEKYTRTASCWSSRDFPPGGRILNSKVLAIVTRICFEASIAQI